ncbi:MAG: ABC transporter substrate-binding protein [Verrucomicrobia bacterium]|nr:ABC transporter substrate-binding protein [Prolixibacteraceae bacterium]
MQKLFAVIATVLCLVALAVSCNQAKSDKRIIGISQIVSHPALDSVVQGIQDELAAQKVDVAYDIQNANGDPNAAASIANKFKSDKVAVAVGVATPTSQALVKAFSEIKSPVVYSAVTDPVDAGLVASRDVGGEYVTGISDLTPIREQLSFLIKLAPHVKKVGMVYSGGEANAVVLKNIAESAAAELGLELISSSIVTSAEVKSAAESIVDKVDAFYVSTDNTVVSALNSLTTLAKAKKKPVMSADPSSSEKLEVLAAWGFNYYKMGRATGRLIKSILDGKKTAAIPTQYMTDAKDVDILINKDVAKALGITIPQDVLDSASIIIENEVATKKA